MGPRGGTADDEQGCISVEPERYHHGKDPEIVDDTGADAISSKEPKQNSQIPPDDTDKVEERPAPAPLAPELLPIGDPAGAA